MHGMGLGRLVANQFSSFTPAVSYTIPYAGERYVGHGHFCFHYVMLDMIQGVLMVLVNCLATYCFLVRCRHSARTKSRTHRLENHMI